MTDSSSLRLGLCALAGLLAMPANCLQAAKIFGDTFEAGTAGANIGSPWAINASTNLTATYQTANNPFASSPFGGANYADLIDTNTTNLTRLLSTAGNNN